MNHVYFTALTCASLFAFGYTHASAHDGHDYGAGSKPNTTYPVPPALQIVPEPTVPNIRFREAPFDQQRTPFEVQDGTVLDSDSRGQTLPSCRGGCCNTPGPANIAPFEFDANISTNSVAPRGPDWNRAGRDLQALAYQLDFAAEIVSEELRLEFARTRGAEQLLAMAQSVNQQTQHLRTSLQEGAEPNHLRGDLQNVAAAVDALSQSLSRFGDNTSAGRGVVRLQWLVAEMTSRLNDRQPVAVPTLPLRPGPFDDGGLRSSTPDPLVIPPEAKGISLLPPEDQRAALAQKTCPVTGQPLGAHGKPLKVQVGGQSIFVCCRGCVDELQANPDKYLAAR